MLDSVFGKNLVGDMETLRRVGEAWSRQPIDWDLADGEVQDVGRNQRTIARPVTVQGPGTFFRKTTCTVTFEPTDMEGWWFERSDLPDVLPFAVSARNVWTTGDVVSNIVLRAGPPHNYVRMVEHMVALKVGMGIDNLLIRIGSGDPPLFNRGSLDLGRCAGVRRHAGGSEAGEIFHGEGKGHRLQSCRGVSDFGAVPPDKPALHVDAAVDFKTAIGQQRIRFPVNLKNFKYGASARTNTTGAKMLYCKTVGKLFADIRNLGYTMENIVVAGRRGYYNEPRLVHNGKSLEAAWHRAALDLLAAIALIEEGQFVGEVISYKAGHGLDVEMIRQLYKNRLLRSL